MTELEKLLRRIAAEPPHIADCTRRNFIRNAARFGLTAAAAAAMTRHVAFAQTTPQTAPQLPAITSIPDKLKGSGTVRVCSFGGAFQDAQRQAYFKPFEQLSGIKVIESEGPDTAKIKAMVDTKNIEYDIAEEDGASILSLAAKGDYWEPIDYSLYDVENIDPVFRSKFYCGMLPYAQIFAFRRDAFGGKTPKDNKDLWDTSTFPGPRSLQSGSGGLTPDLEVASMAAGVPPDKVYPIDIGRAFDSLKRIKPNVQQWWTAGAQPARLLNDNEVVMATAWNGRIAAIQASGAPVDIVWQDQLLRTDVWAIPKGAPNRENAQKFIAFITMAVPQARLSMLIPYGFVNNEAAKHVPPERLKLLPTAPDIKAKLINHDTQWWFENRDDVLNRWNSFILG